MRELYMTVEEMKYLARIKAQGNVPIGQYYWAVAVFGLVLVLSALGL